MAEIWKGQTTVAKLPEYELTPGVGIKTTYRHQAPYATAKAIAAQYFNAKIPATVKQDGDSPVWIVEATIEGENESDLQSQHELRLNLLNPDIKSNPVLVEKFGGGNTAIARIAEIERISKLITGGDSTYDAESQSIYAADNSLFQTAPMIDDAIELLNTMLIGTASYQSFAYVYTHTFNFGNWRDTVADYSNVQCIFTTEQMRDAENIPSTIQLPDGEWLKLPPEQVVQLGQRKQLKYEYWWSDKWSRLLYRDASV